MSIGLGDVPDLGIPSGASETERNTAIDAYLTEIVPRYGPDEATGMLLSDLLGLDDRSIGADLDRVQAELRKCRQERSGQSSILQCSLSSGCSRRRTFDQSEINSSGMGR